MVRQHASRLLSLDHVRELLDVLKAERPAAVEEPMPGLLPLSAVQRILQGLLDEQVWIRDVARVLEGQLVSMAEQRDDVPVLLAAGPLRLPLRRLRSAVPKLPVIAFSETAGIHQIETVGQVSRGHELAA